MSATPDRERLCALAEQIQDRMYEGQEYADLLEAFQRGIPCPGPGIFEIVGLLGPMMDGNYSIDHVVDRALLYQWPKPKLGRQELIELVERIASAEGSAAETDEWLSILEANVPDPAVSDLIFWTEPELAAEEIVDRALAYRVVAMPPPGESHLLWAVRTGNVDVVRALLAGGANPLERSSDGLTALELARTSGEVEILELLTRAAGTSPPVS